jgi:predicted RNase H-like nuclease
MKDAEKVEGRWVAGADGCRAGWFVVLHETLTGATRRRIVPSFEALLVIPEAPVQLAIDVIIGLPDAPHSGGRLCDRETRKLLGWPRSSSVFSPPAQDAIACTTYDEALTVNRRHSPDGIGISKQTFHLFPKLRAVDARMTPAHQKHVREVHPELAFFAMNGELPLRHSKHAYAGRFERVQLLREHGFEDIEAVAETHAGRDVKRDDVLDAHAACWTALRLHQGTARRLPRGKPPYNARGLRMEIWR